MNKKGFIKTWMNGLLIFVLIILAGILTGISIIPLAVISALIGGGGMMAVMAMVSLFVSIFFLGWVFERFKVMRKR